MSKRQSTFQAPKHKVWSGNFKLALWEVTHFSGPKNEFVSSVCDLWPLWPFVKSSRPVTCDRRIDLIGTVVMLNSCFGHIVVNLFSCARQQRIQFRSGKNQVMVCIKSYILVKVTVGYSRDVIKENIRIKTRRRRVSSPCRPSSPSLAHAIRVAARIYKRGK